MDKVKEQVKQKINEIMEEGIRMDNLEALGELVDIHKDIANEEYWDKKKEVMDMNYRGYSEGGYSEGGYGRRGVPGSGRGRYRNYSARGNYRGDEPMEEMYEKYQEYSEGREQYGHDDKGTMKALEYMLEAGVDFFEMLFEDAKTPEAKQMIKHYAKKISEMM